MTNMKITLNRDAIPDELYNQLLLNFVNKAVSEGLPVTGKSLFENWEISCEFITSAH